MVRKQSEEGAVRSLQRVACRWPDTLWLSTSHGVLSVYRLSESGEFVFKNGTPDDAYLVSKISIPGRSWRNQRSQRRDVQKDDKKCNTCGALGTPVELEPCCTCFGGTGIPTFKLWRPKTSESHPTKELQDADGWEVERLQDEIKRLNKMVSSFQKTEREALDLRLKLHFRDERIAELEKVVGELGAENQRLRNQVAAPYPKVVDERDDLRHELRVEQERVVQLQRELEEVRATQLLVDSERDRLKTELEEARKVQKVHALERSSFERAADRTREELDEVYDDLSEKREEAKIGLEEKGRADGLLEAFELLLEKVVPRG